MQRRRTGGRATAWPRPRAPEADTSPVGLLRARRRTTRCPQSARLARWPCSMRSITSVSRPGLVPPEAASQELTGRGAPMTASATSTRRRLWLRAWVRRAETLQSRLVPKAPVPSPTSWPRMRARRPTVPTSWPAVGPKLGHAVPARPVVLAGCALRTLARASWAGTGAGAKGPSSLSERSATGTATQEPSASALRSPGRGALAPTRSPSPQASMTRRADTEGERTVKDRERPGGTRGPWR